MKRQLLVTRKFLRPARSDISPPTLQPSSPPIQNMDTTSDQCVSDSCSASRMTGSGTFRRAELKPFWNDERTAQVTARRRRVGEWRVEVVVGYELDVGVAQL